MSEKGRKGLGSLDKKQEENKGRAITEHEFQVLDKRMLFLGKTLSITFLFV